MFNRDGKNIIPKEAVRGLNKSFGSVITDRTINSFTQNNQVTNVVFADSISTTDLTLSGLQVVSGHTTLEEDIICVNGQSDAKENGIYLAKALTWERLGDLDLIYRVVILRGDYEGQEYEYLTRGAIIDTDNISFGIIQLSARIYETTVTITTAQISALSITPITLLPNPSGRLQILSMILEIPSGTLWNLGTPSGGLIRYISGNQFAPLNDVYMETSGNSFYIYPYLSASYPTIETNKGLEILLNAIPTGGDVEWIFRITYQIF